MEAAPAMLSFSAAPATAPGPAAGWRCAAAPSSRRRRRGRLSVALARLDGGLPKGVPTTNYVVPLDKATGMTRPLVEILRDLNKRVPDKIIDPETNTVPWDATGTAKVHEGRSDDAVAAAEEIAFSKACARFGFGLYLYHQDEIP